MSHARAPARAGEPEAPAGPEHAAEPERIERGLAGLANVAAMTFLAARVVPGGFVVALAGGVPLARASARHGVRAGYATAGASLVETMAVMGPARIGIPTPMRRAPPRWAPSSGAVRRCCGSPSRERRSALATTS